MKVVSGSAGALAPISKVCPPFPQSSHGNTMKQFMDIFSLPEMTLLSCVNEYFLKNNIDYEPVHLYKDVKVVLTVGGCGFASLLPFCGRNRVFRLLCRFRCLK